MVGRPADIVAKAELRDGVGDALHTAPNDWIHARPPLSSREATQGKGSPPGDAGRILRQRKDSHCLGPAERAGGRRSYVGAFVWPGRDMWSRDDWPGPATLPRARPGVD